MAETVIVDVIVDSDQEKRKLAELTKEIRSLNDERTRQRKALQELQKEERRLTAEQDAAQRKLVALAKAGQQNTDAYKQQEAEVRKLTSDLDKLNVEILDQAEAYNQTERQLKSYRKEQRILERESQAVEGSLEKQRATLVRLKAQFSNLSVGVNATEKEYSDLQREIKELTDELKENEAEIGVFQRNVGNYAGGIKEAFGGAIPDVSNFTGILASGPAAVGAVVAGIGVATVKLAEYSIELDKIRGQAQQITDATGAQLDLITARGQALQDTFGTDLEQSFRTSAQGAEIFNESLERSSDLFAQAISTQADGGERLISTFESVSGRLSRANIDLETTFALIADEGNKVGESGKGIEAIAEAVTSLGEQTPATRAAINGLGLDADQVFDLFQRDGFGAITQVTDRMRELPPTSAAVGTALADIFRGPGEDAAGYVLTLGDAETNLQNLISSSDEYSQQQNELRKANEELNLVFNQLIGSSGGFFTELKTQGISLLAEFIRIGAQGLEDLVNFFIDLYNNSLLFRSQIQGVVGVVQTLFFIIRGGVRQVLNSFSTVGSAFKAVFTGNFSDLPGIIAEGLKDAGSILAEEGANVGEAFTDTFNNTVDPKPLEKFSVFGEQQAEMEGQKAGQAFNRGFQSATGGTPGAGSGGESDTSLDTSGLQSVGIAGEDPESVAPKLEELRNLQADHLNQVNEAERIAAEERKRIAEDEAMARIEQENRVRDTRLAVLDSAKTVTDTIISLFGEQSKAGKAAIAAQKAIAITEIGINLQKELSNISTNSSAFPPPLDTIFRIARIAGALARSAGVIANVRAAETGGYTNALESMAFVRAFAKGGMTFEGRQVNRRGSFADGGHVTSPTVGLIGERGREWVAPNPMIRAFPGLFNALESMRPSFVSGASSARVMVGNLAAIPFNDGGFAQRSASRQRVQEAAFNEITNFGDIVANMPNPVISIEHLEKETEKYNSVANAGDA